MNDRLRFESFIERIPFFECWIWNGSLSGSGYGQFYLNGALTGAHRAIWEITFGPIPEHSFVCHRCDVKLCVNPEHLFLGSPLDNMRDMIGKGRDLEGRQKQGQQVRILTDEQAQSIITSPLSFGCLAKEYGVSRATIQHIKQRRTYKHLGTPCV